MKQLILVLLLVFAASPLFAADDASIADKLFKDDDVGIDIAGVGMNSAGKPKFDAVKDPSQLNPGKALLLSAIVPGAGQFYAGSPIRGSIFLAIEIAAWTGVIYYYNKGKDKEEEFENFADTHFHENWYRDVEYGLALNSQWGDSGSYNGSEEEWIQEEWDLKIHYLPSAGFTHELPTHEDRAVNKSHDQQYYEMIGKYIRQFGFGWDKVDFEDFPEDDPSTPYFDGRRTLSEHYMDMRYDSNNFLDYSSYAIQVAMLNHVAAALEAGFEVRWKKRKARAEVGFRQINYDGHPVAVGGLNFKW